MARQRWRHIVSDSYEDRMFPPFAGRFLIFHEAGTWNRVHILCSDFQAAWSANAAAAAAIAKDRAARRQLVFSESQRWYSGRNMQWSASDCSSFRLVPRAPCSISSESTLSSNCLPWASLMTAYEQCPGDIQIQRAKSSDLLRLAWASCCCWS